MTKKNYTPYTVLFVHVLFSQSPGYTELCQADGVKIICNQIVRQTDKSTDGSREAKRLLQIKAFNFCFFSFINWWF